MGTIKSVLSGVFVMIGILCCAGRVSASHLMAADMSYRYLGNGKYLITAHIYRDCRGVSLNNPTSGCFAGNAGSSGCGSATFTMNRISIEDVSPVCADSSRPCNPANTYGSRFGYEKHTYEATVDLNTAPFTTLLSGANCCELTFYVGQCCRNGIITTGQAGDDFFTTTTINVCNVKKTSRNYNNSPVYTSTPVMFTCCNKPYIYNHGIIDSAEQDLIKYKLIHAIKALPDVSVQYSSPFTPTYPMTPYCTTPGVVNCKPNPLASPPVGFFLDTNNGDIVFVPTKCDEVGIVVVEATEYRKDGSGNLLVVGRSRRDMQIIVGGQCSKNNPPEIKGKQVYNICEGDSICFNIDGTDEQALPDQTKADTVKLSWDGGIAGAKFTIQNPGSREKTARFCWKAQPGSSRSGAYTFTVKAIDQACPVYNQTFRSFQIYVCKPGASTRQPLQPDLAVYPQPVAPGGFLYLPSQVAPGSTTMYNTAGQVISKPDVHQNRIIMPQVQPGIYILKTDIAGRQHAIRVLVGE